MMEDPKAHEYWNGPKNRLIRYYFYCQKGLDLFNNFRYVFMAIFGVYYALKLRNPGWLLFMVGVSVPLLTAIGYWSVHHVGKVVDWLNTRFSTHYGLASFELQKEIRDGIKELVKREVKI